MKPTIADYAQYMADRIDTTIFLELVYGLGQDEAFEYAGIYLRDRGWNGRKYPLDFFTIATI